MIIHFDDTELEVLVDDNSYRRRAVKEKDKLVLYYSLTHHVEIPVGAWVEYEGQVYSLFKASNFTKNSTRNFSYTLTLESGWAGAEKYKVKNPVDGRLKFPYTAKPHEFIQLIVDNMNMRESGWEVGECIDAVEQVISFNHAYCSDALNQIADAFDTEWEVEGKTIHLRKVEYFKDNPLALSYGKGNGFKKEISRSNKSDSRNFEILYVQGGTDNIVPGKYGNSELLLPKSQTLVYEGVSYLSSADGRYITQKGKELVSKAEDSLDCSDIYPKRIGSVTSVIEVDKGKHFYDFIDNTIPEELNFSDCLIEGETMTVIPQSGMLVGKEFDVKYKHAERRFEIVPQDIDGETMPNDIYKLAVGDKYAVFHVALPDAYVCNNSDKSGASWDMFREAARFFYENTGELFTFKGELDGIWAKKDWLNIGGRIKPGGYVLFSDEQFHPEGSLVRIISVKDFCNNPHSPTIELSNAPVSSSFQNSMNKVEETEVVIDNKHREALQFTKRRYRDSMETIEMLGDALLDNFSNSINPIAVQTMAMLIGDKSLQFEFVNNMTNPTPIAHNVTYNQMTKVLSVPAGIIQHYTLGIDTISSSHVADEYKFWSLPAFTTPTLTDGTKKYYLYAKVSKTAKTGTFYISEQAIAMEGVSGYYHLLMGVLNSEYDGERSYVSLYGFTEVLPGQVITNKVASANGKNFMDFLNNAFRIGNDKTYIDWNASVANVLSMKNATIQIANTAGQTMIYFSGVDGSGQLAKGNITWDSAGNIKAKGGTFTDVKITGSLRNPFSEADDSFDVDYSDNVVLLSSGGGWITAYSLPWDLGQSGRRICIVNYRWGNTISSGWAAISAPTGKYFYENGISKSELQMSREVIELMGYGDNKTFFGWIVMRRINMMTTSRYGRNLNVLAQGIVYGTSSGASINYKSFDNGTLSVSRLDVGKYRINFPSAWGLIVGSYIVNMTGYLGGLMKASLLEPGASYFVVEVSDDASRNDGAFSFQIINLNDWL
jgi:hypothetical protein|nr:hypothetical protein [Alistipes onderdonkii]